jgi:predicted  nucleic acid-binding Zn-ribbon protein
MSEHQRQADELERELDDMGERSEKLDDQIGDVRDDWERKKKDSSVPGAAGAPERADDDEGAPEQDYPTKD